MKGINMKINNIITAVAVTTAVVASAFAINAQTTIKDQAEYIDYLGDAAAEASVDYENYELQQAENAELRASADSLMNIICESENESWRPMCQEDKENRHWELVVDQVYEATGEILSLNEIAEEE